MKSVFNHYNLECWFVIFALFAGDPDATMGLQCLQPFLGNFVNCSWLPWESQNANTTYVLHYQSLKLGKVLLLVSLYIDL